MTFGEYIEALPNRAKLSPSERGQLLYLLALNAITDDAGISLMAYMPKEAGRLSKLLAKAGRSL